MSILNPKESVIVENVVEEAPEHPKRNRKESDYVHRLRDGEGTASLRGNVLPAGVQSGLRIEELVEEANRGEEWEGVSVEEFVMASVTESAEGIMPSFDEAKRRPDWSKWQKAIAEELNNLKQNGTWELVEHPKDTNIINSKWVLWIKKNAAGEIKKYKARLVSPKFMVSTTMRHMLL